MILNLLILCYVTGRSSGFPISEDKVTSYLYGSVMLPCRFSFAEALTGLSVIWDMEKNYRKLILYKILNGEEKAEEQDPPYRGRVEISTEFPQGNLHLILRNVTYEDEGTYYCRAANAKGHGDRKVTLSIDSKFLPIHWDIRDLTCHVCKVSDEDMCGTYRRNQNHPCPTTTQTQ